MLADLKHRFRALFRGSVVERELDEELRHHLDHLIAANLETGMDRDEAVRLAHRQLGGLDQVKEEYRDSLGVRVVTDTMRDVRYAIRALRRSPVFAVTATISLALGIGVNTLVFSVVNALLLRPLPVSDPERVVFVQHVGPFVAHSYPAYRDLRDRNVTFDALAGYRITMMDVDARQGVSHEWGYLATGNYFDLLGVRPIAGRFFHAEDDRAPGASAYAVLSYEYWQTHFGGDPAVVGSTIRINRIPYAVLGVAPAGFHGTEIFYRPNLWIPMSMQAQIEVGNPWLENRNTSNTWVIGRLRPGVSIEQAESNLTAILRQLAREYHLNSDRDSVKLTRPGLVGDALGGPARAFGLGVLALAGLVLLTTCANLASTLAARSSDRKREFAIRLSIGAGRGRLVRQLLTEAIVLAVFGGSLGALAAVLGARALSSWQLPIVLPVQVDVHPDARVLVAALLVALAAGIGVGLAPARHAMRAAPAGALKSLDGTTRHRWPARDVLVGVQVALCFVLVAACLMSLRGLKDALTMPLGFEPASVSMATFDLGLAGYSRETGERLRQRVLEEIGRLPGVENAAYANSLPLNIDQSSTIVVPDDRRNLGRQEYQRAIKYQVSPGYFQTLRIRMLAGRDFDWRDTHDSPRIAIVNEAFVHQVLRARDGIGRHFGYGVNGLPVEIVGVVETGKYQSLTEAETPVVFQPILQAYNTTSVMLVRSSWPASQMAAEIRRVLQAIDPAMPVFGTSSLDDMLRFALLPMRIAAVALGAFGLLAVTLAATGIYGVVAYAVARRRREIAIRVAVGATHRRVLQLVLRRLATCVAIGSLFGVLLALALRPILQRVIYLTSTNDLTMLLAVGAIVGVVALVASWVPARRALRMPATAALYVD